MTITTPTTELEAVNAILATIGEAPINSLNQPGLTDALLAQTLLGQVSRQVQSQGWNFNTEVEYALPATFGTGEVALPPNCLQFKLADSIKGTMDLVQRGMRLYDRGNQTFNIGKTIKANLTLLLTFEDMPEAARWFVTVRAARMFLDRTVGSESLHGFSEDDERVAKAQLDEAEGDTADKNILFGNYSVYRSLDRYSPAWGDVIVQ